jgi:hypothetical protein
MAGTQQLGLTTYKGRWALDYDGTTRELDINGVNAQTRALDATILDNAGRAVPVSGTVRAIPAK